MFHPAYEYCSSLILFQTNRPNKQINIQFFSMENPIKSETETAPVQKILYVDIMHFCDRFVGGNNWKTPKQIISKTKKFANSFTKAGWNIEVFIDARINKESNKKWKSRRSSEIKKFSRSVPQGISALLGEAFHKFGIKVHYSTELDLDDVIFSHAFHNGAAILSGNRSMIRYVDKDRTKIDLQLFKDYQYRHRELILVPFKPVDLKDTRAVICPPPAISSTLPEFHGVRQTGRYVRGSPSPLTQDLGNLHITVRPLRKALYARMKLNGPITEVFPVWNSENDKVDWLEEKVMPDSTLDNLLDNYEAALSQFFPNLEANTERFKRKFWRNHVYACKLVVLELICEASKKSLLDTLDEVFLSERKARTRIPRRHRNQALIRSNSVSSLTDSIATISIDSPTKSVSSAPIPISITPIPSVPAPVAVSSPSPSVPETPVSIPTTPAPSTPAPSIPITPISPVTPVSPAVSSVQMKSETIEAKETDSEEEKPKYRGRRGPNLTPEEKQARREEKDKRKMERLAFKLERMERRNKKHEDKSGNTN